MITSSNNSLLSGILLILLHVGFSSMKASHSRPQEKPHSHLEIFLHIFVSIFVHWLMGYSFYHDRGNFFFGLPTWPWAQNETDIEEDWLFKSLVEAVPVTILAGTVMEFCHPVAFLLNTVFLTGVSQPIAEYWVRNPTGWLRKLKYKDFSGGSVVFGFAGASCFSARLFIRTKNKDYSQVHSTALYGIGSLLVVLGFLIMNCGSIYYLPVQTDINYLANKIAQNTVLAGAGGCIVTTFVATITMTKQSIRTLTFVVNGTFAGMIAICSSADTYFLYESLLIGSISATFYILIQYLFICIQEQDINGALSVYLSSGLWSTLAPHIVTSNGLLFSADKLNSLQNLVISFVGTSAICTWAALWTIGILLILKFFGLLNKDGRFESPNISRCNLSDNTQNTEEYYIEALPYTADNKHRNEGETTASVTNNCVRSEQNVYENLNLDVQHYAYRV